MKRLTALIATTMLCLTGCSEPDIQHYVANSPKFDIREYFNGELEAWGAVINRDGTADPQFFIKMKGSWKGNKGTLEEEFIYSDGTRKHRTWHFEMVDDTNFIATAADVTGKGKGQQVGNAVHVTYTLQVPYKGRTIELAMDDWLFRIDDKHVINRAEMRKFGIKVGELVVSFRKKAS